MSDKKYKVEIADFGERGDLKNGWGYSIYLNEKEGHKSFEQKICIYEFDSHILILDGDKEENNFPLGIESKNNIEKAEKRAHEIALRNGTQGLINTLFNGKKENVEIIDKTRIGKGLVKKL
jgi:predicted RNA-binding protein with TRAM domain